MQYTCSCLLIELFSAVHIAIPRTMHCMIPSLILKGQGSMVGFLLFYSKTISELFLPLVFGTAGSRHLYETSMKGMQL